MLMSWCAYLKSSAWPLAWRLIGRSHAHTGSINTLTNRNDLMDTIFNGQRTETSQNY